MNKKKLLVSVILFAVLLIGLIPVLSASAATTETLTSARVTLSATSFTYNGAVQKPTVTVKNAAGTTLTANTHYTLTFSGDSKYPGSYTVKVTGKGSYSGTVSKSYTIAKQPIVASRVTLSDSEFSYNCLVQQPTVTVKNAAGGKMTQDASYTVSYSAESKYPGTYTVTVTAKGYYTGSIEKTYKIVPQPIDSSRVTLSATSFTYNGTIQKPNVTVKNSYGNNLTQNAAYTLSYSADSKAPGTYTVTATAKGYYSGSITKTYTIAKQPIDASRITLSNTSFTYNGAIQKPSVTPKNASGVTMKPDIQYKVAYSAESKAPGTYTVTVTGVGYYTGKAEKTYTIARQPIDASRVTLSNSSFTYNGTVQKPSVTPKNASGITMKPDIQYTVTYSAESKTPGSYTVTVTGIGYYTGTVKKTYTIDKQPIDVSNVSLSATELTYNGELQEPAVTVRNASGAKLTQGSSYTVSFSSGKNVGTYTVTVSAKGYYTGTAEKTYSIVPQSIGTSSITLSSDTFTYNSKVQKPTATVKNAAGGTLTADDYTIAYSTESKYPGTYTVTVTGKGNYTGSAQKTYTITKQPLDASRVTLSADSFIYNGSVQHPSVTVRSAAGGVMTLNSSYTVAYTAGSTEPGAYTVTVTGKGYYTGTVTKQYTILPQTAIADADVTISGTCFQYNGAKQQPDVTVTVAGKTLTPGTDYTVSLSGGAVENGTYTLTVTGVNAYTGEVEKTFVISASGHTPAVIPAVAATCTETGMSEGSRCTVCGEIITAPAETPALGHDMTQTPAVAATCMAGGNNAYYTCGRCEKVFADADGTTETTPAAQQTAAVPHSYTGVATCNEDGTHTVACVYGCGESVTEDCIFGEWDVITEGTCDKEGQRKHTCTVCGYEAQEAYFGHEFIWKHYPATCVVGAFREKVCDICGDIFATVIDENSESRGGHSLPETATTVAPTCTEDGYSEKRCQFSYTVEIFDENDEYKICDIENEHCGHVEKTDPTPALGHNLPEANWIEKLPPSCLADGLEECECLRCHEIISREKPSLGGHHFETDGYGKDPTCTTDGVRQSVCVNCGKIQWQEIIPAAHDWTDETIVKKSTCVEHGQAIRNCKNCYFAPEDLQPGAIVKTTVDTDLIDAGTYGVITAINPDGTYTLDFSILGYDEEIDYDYTGIQDVYELSELNIKTTEIVELPLADHKLTKTVQPATCENAGYYSYSGTCSVCGNDFDGTRVEIPALGHIPDRTEPTCTEPVKCLRTNCDCENNIVKPALGHDYTIPGCVLSDNAQGFFCSRCEQMRSDKTAALTNLLNLLKADSFVLRDPTSVPTVAAFNKTKTTTVNKAFDFGVYTSLVKDIYERDVAETSLEYVTYMPSRVRTIFPLAEYFGPGQYFVVKTGEDGLTDADLTNLKVEQLPSLNTNDLLNGFVENADPTSGEKPDLSRFSNVAINEPVVRISLDVADDIYAKGSSINNVDDSTDANGDYLHETHISKICDYDVREPVRKAGFTDANGWKITEGSDSDGYTMDMQLKSVKADARITYYFTANGYRPIGAVYQIKETMDQEITMKILTVKGDIIPIITTENTNVYLFEDFFNN